MKKTGFTLIEILVCIAIFLIIIQFPLRIIYRDALNSFDNQLKDIFGIWYNAFYIALVAGLIMWWRKARKEK